MRSRLAAPPWLPGGNIADHVIKRRWVFFPRHCPQAIGRVQYRKYHTSYEENKQSGTFGGAFGTACALVQRTITFPSLPSFSLISGASCTGTNSFRRRQPHLPSICHRHLLAAALSPPIGRRSSHLQTAIFEGEFPNSSPNNLIFCCSGRHLTEHVAGHYEEASHRPAIF